MDAEREGKVPLALESVLMSVLHSPVMQSLVTLHAQTDAAIHKQAKMRCKPENKVLACHKAVTACPMELNSRRRSAIAPSCQAKQHSVQDQCKA